MAPLIQLSSVSKTYRMGDVEVRALRDVNLSVDAGDFVAVMGTSGSGKSTLMNIVGCLDRPSGGSYLLDGSEVSRLSRNDLARVRNRTLGFVFQSFNLLNRTSALENVELPLVYAGVKRKERARRAREALEKVGLGERLDHTPGQLSGGQQQRVAIARALVGNPRLILGDEPTGNLDSRTSIEVVALFQEFGRQGITVVLVTHEPDIAQYASRVILVKDGRVLSDKRQTPLPAVVPPPGEDDATVEAQGVMNVLETLRVALRALLRNKTRSFLTTLGIIIGVGAVIAMVAIGEGAKSQVEQAFASMGTNLLIVLPGSSSQGGSRGGFGSQPTLTWEDLKAMQTEVSSVRYAVPVLRSNASVLAEDSNWTTSIQGTSPAYFDIRSWPMQLGQRFNDSDVDSGAKVVVLGATVSEKLFGASSDPVGQLVRLKNIPFVVVGVAAKKGQSPMGQDYDDTVFIPYPTFQTKIQGGLGKFLSGQVMVSAVSADSTERAEKDLTTLLRDRHHLGADAEDDFSIRNLAELASNQAQSTQTLTTLLACIAAVSLLVGGIGIMNIMLVSVTERTREIGLRMAIGARPLDILAQFLIEALALATAGGLIGVASGIGTARYLASSFHWAILVRPDVVAVAVAFSALVGVVFGLYPARKASRLDPIDALRYE